MGRKSSYNPDDHPILAAGYARKGLTNAQIAHNLGISEATLYGWAKKHLEFAESLKKQKEVVDFEVENALLKRAMGYEAEERVLERQALKDANGQPVLDDKGQIQYALVETKRTIKHVAGDTTAQIFWLKNRQPARWRDTKDMRMSGTRTLEELLIVGDSLEDDDDDGES